MALLPHHSASSIRGKVERLGLHKGGRCVDYTNKRIGVLHVIERVYSRSSPTPLWHAICQCGKHIEITSYSIRYQHIPSCGCQRPISKTSKEPLDRTLDYYIKQYRQKASRDQIEWNLTRQEFASLIKQNCNYCGIQPSRIANAYNATRCKEAKSSLSRARHKTGEMLVNGIDRVDSKRGYSVDNCVPCCKHCNVGKLDQTKEQFLQWINRVWTHQNKEIS